MKNLNYELLKLCLSNKDGSYSTQAKRKATLNNIANILHEEGFKKLTAKGLKPKHINRLVQHWKGKNLSEGTIKNNLSALRWWANKTNKLSIMYKDNSNYGIEKRQLVTNKSKAQKLDLNTLEQINCDYIKASLRLQAAFGLRREESIKFNPNYATRGQYGYIKLKSTWTKGGKARVIPIRTQQQKEALEYSFKVAGGGALIPQALNYVKQLRRYELQTSQVGLKKLHGLRHHYAQKRYTELTGNLPPVLGGVPLNQLKNEDWKVDNQARLIISKELGHERKDIVSIYLGGRETS